MGNPRSNGNGVGHLLDHARRLGSLEATVTQHGQRLTAVERRTARHTPSRRLPLKKLAPYAYGLALLAAAVADKISWTQAGKALRGLFP